MVASDEKAYDGCEVARPMTIPELCREGELKGSRFEQHYGWFLADYYFQMVMATFPVIGVAALLAVTVGLATGAGFLVLAAAAIIIVPTIIVVRKNILMVYHMEYLRRDPLNIMATVADIVHLINNPAPVRFTIFGEWERIGVERDFYRAINRSDGSGNIVVFMRFDDDHDRVMFRLSR